MRNSVVLVVAKIRGQLAAHFCESTVTASDRPLIEIKVNQHRTSLVPVPEKLQGADYNLLFPLAQATSIHDISFQEIENIMILNGVANNVTSITALDNGSAIDQKRYCVVFNNPVTAQAA